MSNKAKFIFKGKELHLDISKLTELAVRMRAAVPNRKPEMIKIDTNGGK